MQFLTLLRRTPGHHHGKINYISKIWNWDFLVVSYSHYGLTIVQQAEKKGEDVCVERERYICVYERGEK